MKAVLIIVLCLALSNQFELFDKLRKAQEIPQINCHDETKSDDTCLVMESEMKGDAYQCKSNIYCTATSDYSAKCLPIKKYKGDECTKSDECQSDNCVEGKCEYKEDGATCNKNKECGLKSFCSNGKCKQYLLEENADCDTETNLCSPKFFCDESSNKCQLRATKGKGEDTVSEDQCKSFYAQEGKCVDCLAPIPALKFMCTEANCKKEQYGKINWDTAKLSDYYGSNMGSTIMLDDMYDLLEFMGFSDIDCLKPVMNQVVATSIISEQEATVEFVQDDMTLPDETIKKILASSHGAASFLGKSFLIMLVCLFALI